MLSIFPALSSYFVVMGTQYTSLASSSQADGSRPFHRSLTPPAGPGNSKSPTPTSSQEDDYPPPDHGLPAWMFLFGCFWIECFVWGEIVIPVFMLLDWWENEIDDGWMNSTAIFLRCLSELLCCSGPLQGSGWYSCCGHEHTGMVLSHWLLPPEHPSILCALH